MIDRIRRDIQQRLEQALEEADRLRRALAALGPHQTSALARRTRARGKSADSAPPTRAASAPSARATAAPSPQTSGKKPGARATTAPARKTTGAKPTASKPGAAPPPSASATAASKPARTAPGATKAKVLAALSSNGALTAGEVAKATGLARPTVSTTLSKLAKSGEVQKAERGYKLAAAGESAPAAAAE